MTHGSESNRILWKQTALRVYISGFISLAILYLAWRAVAELSPWFATFENKLLAVLLSIVTLLVVPPLLGCIIQFVINPVLAKWSPWSQVVGLQDRLVGELSKTKNLSIVLVNWPNESIQTIGIMTAKFPAIDSRGEMAAVFIAHAPRSKFGDIRIVPVSDIGETGWTLKDFQLFQLTIGSMAPAHLTGEQ